MHRRYQHSNLPIEVIRTFVAIEQTGSFTKAGERLGLSQPAISAQVKRLQGLIGGVIFERNGGKPSLTSRGKLVLSHAKRLLDANDQILSLGGTPGQFQPLRFGLSGIFVEAFLEAWRKGPSPFEISFTCAHSAELERSFAEGHLDVACVVNPRPETGEPILQWQEDFVWVRSLRFVLSPGSPLPLVAWPDGISDQQIIQAVEKAGLAYRIVLTSADHHTRLAAVKAGIGLMGLPARQVDEPLVVAQEYYLPPLGPLSVAVFARAAADKNRIAPVVDRLKSLTADATPTATNVGASRRSRGRSAFMPS